jgi:hypothetical protein
VLGEPAGADRGEIVGEHLSPKRREHKFAQLQPGAARASNVATTPDQKEVTMKTQSIYTTTTRSLLTLAVMVMVLLLAGSRAATATIVPSTYNTDTFPFYGGPPPEALRPRLG